MKIFVFWIWASMISLAVNCQNTGNQPGNQNGNDLNQRSTSMDLKAAPDEAIFTIAGGCFWCVEEVYERTKGVHRAISGYAGGHTKNPTYESSNTGQTGHAETVQVYYNPDSISFHTLLEVFFLAAHDPTQVDRQGPDVGTQYRSIAFYRSPEEKDAIENYMAELNASGKFEKPIATEIKKLDTFYPAEDYHQNYYPQNPGNPYIQKVSRPKVEKFERKFPELVK
ncbi:peptide-methionine (S)-S-oxide reductase MsrA [Membranihabitans marinus]|nr:peptide-methionine (S)-S-oxide reductase MsrA [Membranihabitans marinus]